MATGNVTLTSTESNITVTSTPSNIIVSDIETGDQITVTNSNTNLTVTSATTNVTVSDFALFANDTIRAALSNVSPILYDSGTGIFSFDSNASFAGKTTDDLAEGNTNLYLNGAGTTDDLTEGATNLYLNGAGTTDDLTEGASNLYYTNARVLAYIQDNGLDFNAEKVDDRVANLLQTTGNLTFTYDDGANTLTLSQSLTTDDITEGDNLYYTTDRANSAINALLSTGTTGDAIIGGNLNVLGNIDYTHVNDLYVANSEIIMNANAATDTNVLITVNRPVAGSNAHLKWNETDDKWEFYDGSTSYNIPRTTTDLAEGTNLYYTVARANTAIDNKLAGNVTIGNLTVSGSGGPFEGNIITQQLNVLDQANINTIKSVGNITSNANISSSYFKGIWDGIVDDLGSNDPVNWGNVLSSNTTGNIAILRNRPTLAGPGGSFSTLGIDVGENSEVYYNGNAAIYTGLPHSSDRRWEANILQAGQYHTKLMAWAADPNSKGTPDYGNLVLPGGRGVNNRVWIGNYNGYRNNYLMDLSFYDVDGDYRVGLAPTEAVRLDSLGNVTADANIIANNYVIADDAIINNTITANDAIINNTITAGLFSGNVTADANVIANNYVIANDAIINNTITANDAIINNTITAGLFSGDGGGLSNLNLVSNSGGTVQSVTAGAGMTQSGNANINPTLDVVGGYGITANADDIEIANADVRALFSANGDLSYNSTTGVFSFTNDAGGYSNVDVQNFLENGYSAANINANDIVAVTFTGNGVISTTDVIQTNTVAPANNSLPLTIGANVNLTNTVANIDFRSTGNVTFYQNDTGTFKERLRLDKDGGVLIDIQGNPTSDASIFKVANGSSALFTVTNAGDGTSTINATGTITGSNLTIAGLSYPSADGSNGQVLTTDGAGTLSFTTVSGGASANAFGIISVAGQSNVEADVSTDQVTFVAGSGITLTTDAANDSITFVSTGGYGNVDVDNYINNGYPTANISRLSVGAGNIGLDSGLLTFPDLQFYSESSAERYFIGAQLSAGTSNGVTDAYVKSRGNVSAPAVINSNDIIKTSAYYAHDGTSWLNTFGTQVYQDAWTGGVSTNVIPLAYEIYTQQDGDINAGYPESIVKFRSDRTIAFNDGATRSFPGATGGGNANITQDGTINTVSNINASGTITGGNLTIAGLSYPSADGTVNQAIVTDGNGNLTFGSVASGYGDANVDAHLNTATATTGQVLSWDGADYDWITTSGTYSNADVQNFLENGYSAANINANDIVAVTFTGDGSDLTDVRAETVEVTLKVANTEPTGNILKGYPVHAVGYSGTGEIEAVLADAGNADLMPAHFIALEDIIGVGSTGRGLLTGQISGVDTSTFQVGETIYVAVGGGYSNTAPTGEANQIQNLGIVTRIDATQGGGEVYGAGRSAATPNLNDGNIFLGNASNESVTAPIGALTVNVGTTGNLDLNSATAVDNLYGLKWDSSVNKFISSPDAATTAPDHFITIEKDTTDLEAIRGRVARSGAFGWKERYEKAEGTLASPTALGGYDQIWQAEHFGHDGVNGYGGSGNHPGIGLHTFQDGRTAFVSANTTPMAFEIYGALDGNVDSARTSGSVDQSFLSIHADGKIVFNDPNGTRGLNLKQGTANISRDGTIISAADIIARGNVEGTNFLGNVTGNVTGFVSSISNFTTDDLTEGASNLYFTTARFNNEISNYGGDIANLTGELATTGNVNFNGGNVTIGDTSAIFGLRNLKYDYNNNRLGLGTGDNVGVTADGSGAFGPLHILSDNSTTARIVMEELEDTTSGPDFRFYKGRGSYSAPTTILTGDRLKEELYYAYDGTDYGSSRARMSIFADNRSGTGYDQANGIITASHEFGVNAADGSTNIAPMQIQGGTGNVLFGLNALRNTGSANASIGFDGTITTVSGINATGTVTANNFSGSGSTLTGIDSWGVIEVSGQTSVVANTISSNLTLQSAGAIEITTDAANGTVIIGGTGGTYGNTDVENFLSSNTYTANLDIIGNVNVNQNSVNVVTASGNISNYFGNVNTGSIDQIQMNGVSADPGWTDGTALLFAGTSNPDLTFLNGNVYYTKSVGSTYYELYNDEALTSGLQSNLSVESPTGLTAEYVSLVDVQLEVEGDIKASNATFTDSIQAFTPGGTITCQSLRVNDFAVTQPFGINIVANSDLSSGPYTNPFRGSLVHVTGDRYGADGAPAYWSGSVWKYISDDANVTI